MYLKIKKPEHNYLILTSKIFLFNYIFLQIDIIIIKNNLKTYILAIKTFAKYYNFNKKNVFYYTKFI